MPAKKQSKQSITDALKELQETVEWFEGEEATDIEKGLTKVKEGAALVKDLKGRLKEIENEFTEITAELEDEG